MSCDNVDWAVNRKILMIDEVSPFIPIVIIIEVFLFIIILMIIKGSHS